MKYDELLVGFTIAIGLLALAIAAYIFISMKKTRGAWQVGVLFLLESIYAIGYALELASQTLIFKVLFNHMQYFGIPFIAITWLYVAKKFQNATFKNLSKFFHLFLIIPVLSFFIVQFTFFGANGISWFYTSASIQPYTLGAMTIPVMVLGKGFLYYLNAVNNIAIIFFVVRIYIITYRSTSGIHKKQALSLAVLSMIGILATIATLFSRETSGIDWSLYFVVIVGYFVLFSMYKYEMFDLMPSAHRATFELATDPILILDDKFDIVSWNRAVKALACTGAPLHAHTKLEECFEDKGIIDAIRNQKPYSFKRNDIHFIMETLALRTKRRSLNGFLVKFNDMTSYFERIEKLDYQASHDELTKALNRRAFYERADRYLSQIQNTDEVFATMMLDLDDFKEVNDTYGHTIGDVVLEDLTQVVKNAIPEDAIFSRYGGEEFVILVQDCYPEKARRIAEQMREAVAMKEFVYGDIRLGVKISIGIACSKHLPNTPISEYIKKADEALYRSKRAGKNRSTLIDRSTPGADIS